MNYYTGLPDVKIPLYTYQHKGLTVPIYLAYHSTGLLVDAQASEVGLGWSLRAGGVIGRTLYGYSDLNPGGYATGTSVPSQKQVSKLYNFYKQTAQYHQRDSEPDVYNFTFGSESGRFVLDSTATPRTVPFKDVRIVRIDDGHYAITDEQGIQYRFGGLDRENYSERTRTEYGTYCTMPPPGDPSVDSRREFVSASYLTHMISPTGDTIFFRYTPDTVAYRNPIDYTLHKLELTGGDCEPIFNYNQCYTTTIHTGYKISEITSASGVRVQFTYARTKRLDVPTSRALEAVEITDGTTHKRYTLQQGYFASAGATPQPIGDQLEHALQYRLRLDAVQEQGVPSYRLAYHQSTAHTFPARGSFAQDALGYFNGRPNSGLVHPLMFEEAPAVIDPLEPTPILGVDRRIDTAAVKLGMLERITYPTGGVSRFTYEANDRFVGRYFPEDSLIQHALLQVSANDEVYPGRSQQLQQTFTLTRETSMRLHAKLFTTVFPEHTSFGAYIVNRETGQGVYSMAPGTEDKRTIALPAGTYTLTAYAQDLEGNPVFLRVDALEVYVKNRYIGNYPFYGCRIKSIVSSGKTSFGEDATTSYAYRQSGAPTSSSGYVLYEPKLKYEKLMTIIKTKEFDVIGNETKFSPCTYKVISQSPLNPVGSIQGGNIAYATVTVTEKSRQADLRTQYQYSQAADQHYTASYPFPPPTSYDWQRGLLLKKVVLANQGEGRYRPVQISRNTYTALHNPYIVEQVGGTLESDALLAAHPHETIIPAYRVYMTRPEVVITFTTFLKQYPGIYQPYQYYYVSAFQHLAQEEITTYGPQGDSMSTRKFYTHASPRHTQPTAIKTLTSAGDTLVTRLSYPLDYILAGTSLTDTRVSALQRLQTLHIVSPVIERTTHLAKQSRQTIVLGGQLTEYGLVGQVPVPRKTWTYQPAAPGPFAPLAVVPAWTQDRQYKLDQEASYDLAYNVHNIKVKGLQESCFLWGADKEVLAVTRYATTAQVAYTSFEQGSAGSWTYAPAQCEPGGRGGQWSYRLGSTPVQRPDLPAGTYQVWFWTNGQPTVSVNAVAVAMPASPIATAPNGWRQYCLYLTTPVGGTVALAGTGLLDEVRLHPIGAQMTSYTQEPLTGIRSQTGPDGRTVFYEYDPLGRLQRTRDEQGRVLSENEYRYARPQMYYRTLE